GQHQQRSQPGRFWSQVPQPGSSHTPPYCLSRKNCCVALILIMLPLVAPGISLQVPDTLGALCRQPTAGDQAKRASVARSRVMVSAPGGNNGANEGLRPVPVASVACRPLPL